MNHCQARLFMAAAVLFALSVCAQAVTVESTIRPNNMNGWTFALQNSTSGYPVGEFTNLGMGTPPMGTGALHVVTENPALPADYLQKVYLGTNRHTGLPLKNITKFKYYTYLHSRAWDGTIQPGGQPPVVEIVTDSGTTGQQRIFQYQPYGWDGTAASHVAFDTWQEWDLLAANDGHYHWGMVYWVDSGNIWGDWNWVCNRYGTSEQPMKLATPNVGDVLAGYDENLHVSNQAGSSLCVKVGAAKAGYKTYDPLLRIRISPWPQFHESAGIDGYADKLVIEADGVEYIYNFESEKAPAVAITGKAAKDAVANSAKGQYAFVVCGKVVMDPWPEPDKFWINDGSGDLIQVNAPVQTMPNQIWRAEGYLDNTTSPVSITTTAQYVYRLK